MASKLKLRLEEARNRLTELGVTQAALASMCLVDQRTVQRWFAGQGVRLEDAERVARALGQGTADLFDGVPEHGLGATLTRIGALHRVLAARDGVVGQCLRAIQRKYPVMLDQTTLFGHPLRGYVASFRLAPAQANGFVALRVRPRGERPSLRVLDRVARSVLFERARAHHSGNDVWLVENFFVRCMRAPIRADGSFDLWYWAGPEVEEFLVVSTTQVMIELRELDASARPLFDMASAATQHAVCVRPTASQISSAGLEAGFDRVIHRNPARVDLSPVHGG